MRYCGTFFTNTMYFLFFFFITALFIIARTWKQPRCPSADDWIRKLWYIYTMEYYSAVKKNSFESVLYKYYVISVTQLKNMASNPLSPVLSGV